jgi:hypothetical protein
MQPLTGRALARRRLRLRSLLVAVCLTGAVVGAQAPAAGAAAIPPTFSPSLGALPFPADVYQLSSTGVLSAVNPAYTPPSAPLYNAGGSALGLSWEQFSAATATSDGWISTHGASDFTNFWVQLSGLIPNGVYSLFYRSFGPDSVNPVCAIDPLVALPAGAPQPGQPDADSFVADGSGQALFYGRVAGNLLAASQLQLVVIYHYDGHTYGPVPTWGETINHCLPSFGVDAMRQLLIIQK